MNSYRMFVVFLHVVGKQHLLCVHMLELMYGIKTKIKHKYLIAGYMKRVTEGE